MPPCPSNKLVLSVSPFVIALQKVSTKVPRARKLQFVHNTHMGKPEASWKESCHFRIPPGSCAMIPEEKTSNRSWGNRLVRKFPESDQKTRATIFGGKAIKHVATVFTEKFETETNLLVRHKALASH